MRGAGSLEVFVIDALGGWEVVAGGGTSLSLCLLALGGGGLSGKVQATAPASRLGGARLSSLWRLPQGGESVPWGCFWAEAASGSQSCPADLGVMPPSSVADMQASQCTSDRECSGDGPPWACLL